MYVRSTLIWDNFNVNMVLRSYFSAMFRWMMERRCTVHSQWVYCGVGVPKPDWKFIGEGSVKLVIEHTTSKISGKFRLYVVNFSILLFVCWLQPLCGISKLFYRLHDLNSLRKPIYQKGPFVWLTKNLDILLSIYKLNCVDCLIIYWKFQLPNQLEQQITLCHWEVIQSYKPVFLKVTSTAALGGEC